MQGPYADLLKRIYALSSAELVAIDARARELGVGGSQWEEAWLAARQGHTSAITAYSRSVSAGATPIAAAAIAGAVAAQHTDALITQDQYETLVQPVVEAIAPGRQAIVERDVKTGLRILSNLGVIWDRCGTVQQRRQFAKLLFSRMTRRRELSAARVGS